MKDVLKFQNLLILVVTICQTFDYGLAVKRGPHHPRSERKVDQHLTHEEQ